MNNKNKIIAGIVGLVLFLGGFWAGSFYHTTKTPAGNFARGTMGGGSRTGVMNSRGGGLVAGSILAKDDKSITVQLQTGGSKIVFISASTTVMKSAPGSADDLQVGTNVMAQGGSNADGSVTAQSIQIRPTR